MSETNGVPVRRLILVPALITFAVTILRLGGELMDWSPALFSREAGGAGALIGIVWLVPIFGIVFAMKLAAMGYGPPGVGRALGFVLLGLLASVAIVAVGVATVKFPARVVVLPLAAGTAVLIAWRGWPALSRTLMAYGLAARIPVALIMLPAILGRWGTHYDAPPPGFPPLSPLLTWFLIGLIPQLTIWVAFTLVVGALVGTIAVALTRRGAKAQPATHAA